MYLLPPRHTDCQCSYNTHNAKWNHNRRMELRVFFSSLKDLWCVSLRAMKTNFSLQTLNFFISQERETFCNVV